MRAHHKLVALLVVGTLLAGSGAAAARHTARPGHLAITHGIASGDVTATSAVIWARAGGRARMHVEYGTDPRLAAAKTHASAAASAATDYTAHVRLKGLVPDTTYYYRVWFSGVGGNGRSAAKRSSIGMLRTAPDPATSRAVKFVWGGDVGGQRYCRQAGRGYDIFAHMQALAPDFFIANGDMIYADGDCPVDGPDGPGGWQNIPGDFPNILDPAVNWAGTAQVREIFLRHWRYNRADPHQQSFLRSTSMYAQWDDHEVVNDFGAPWIYWNLANANRPGYPGLVAAGRETFFHYAPIERHRSEPDQIYRAFKWGADLDLLIVDARSYRSRNDLADTPANRKTLLGAEQLAWLKEQLLSSRATWKVISSDVPFSIPTGSDPAVNGRDGWANGTLPDYSSQTGFEREMLDLVRFLDDHRIANVVFVTTDVHFAQSIRYAIDANGDGTPFVFHEFVSGPLNAFRLQPGPLDPTLNPTSLYAEGNIFNFGFIRLQRAAGGTMHLIADVRDETGTVRPGSVVDLAP